MVILGADQVFVLKAGSGAVMPLEPRCAGKAVELALSAAYP